MKALNTTYTEDRVIAISKPDLVTFTSIVTDDEAGQLVDNCDVPNQQGLPSSLPFQCHDSSCSAATPTVEDIPLYSAHHCLGSSQYLKDFSFLQHNSYKSSMGKADKT